MRVCNPSECPNLAKHIQALQIHTLHLPTIKNIKRVIPSFTLDSNESETAKGSLISASNKNVLGSLDKDTCRKYYEKQQELMTCSDTWSRLHDAFLRLEACKEVAFNSKNPPRDSSPLEQSFGTLLQRSRAKSSASTKFILHLIFGVLNAAANHKSQIKSFEIHIGCAIHDVLYRILTFAFGFLKPITGLNRLHLVIEHDFEQDKLQKFFDLFPGLTDLKLEMDSRESVKISGGALSVLHVPNLQKLTLAMMNCIPVELEDLIIRHQKTLQDITLVCITLPDDRSWRLIFQKIVENLKIKRFSMGKCLQDEDLEPSDITKLIDSINSAKWISKLEAKEEA
ncbi:hypothetical protein FOMG_18852 [Fusarium oxysporum f. sp. melonis 26406]|uniref:Uncharacterized protein n=1 Tax=Fusarium oxysporum f. sp. melonis 26406 TaxID=1089452 RepID=W9Z824_FUSOX|nr:hypothetical protein FOMG_18852 [Fusarium oxysporum f. sp. melonis 26406]